MFEYSHPLEGLYLWTLIWCTRILRINSSQQCTLPVMTSFFACYALNSYCVQDWWSCLVVCWWLGIYVLLSSTPTETSTVCVIASDWNGPVSTCMYWWFIYAHHVKPRSSGCDMLPLGWCNYHVPYWACIPTFTVAMGRQVNQSSNDTSSHICVTTRTCQTMNRKLLWFTIAPRTWGLGCCRACVLHDKTYKRLADATQLWACRNYSHQYAAQIRLIICGVFVWCLGNIRYCVNTEKLNIAASFKLKPLSQCWVLQDHIVHQQLYVMLWCNGRATGGFLSQCSCQVFAIVNKMGVHAR